VLGYAIWHCESLFRVIWLTRLDNPTPNAAIKDAEPDPDLWMRVTSLDTVTGQFTAESV
jgi:hypothetical protein